MGKLLQFIRFACATCLAAILLLNPAAATTMEGEVTQYETFTFEESTHWGKASIYVALPALRYRFFTLFSEPVYTLNLKFHITRVVLENRSGQTIIINVDDTGLKMLGSDYTTFVRTTGAGQLTVGTDIIKSLRMIDVDIRMPLRGVPAMIYRQMPGMIGATGSWSRDVPGSPSWSRLFVHPLAHITTLSTNKSEYNYLTREDAKSAWIRLVETSRTTQIVQTFYISNATFDVNAFIARISEVAPSALEGFFDRSKTQKQAEALVGAYVGAVESLRDENGMPPEPDAVNRRRKLTVRALQNLRDAGLVEGGIFNSMNRTHWEQLLAGVDHKLSELADDATEALQGTYDDPSKLTEPLRARLDSLRAEASTYGEIPRGIADRFDRLASILDVNCSTFVTAGCDPLLEFFPADGATVDKAVANISGRVKAEFVSSLESRLTLLVGEQEQRVSLAPDGAFTTKAVLASGENLIRLSLNDPNGEPGNAAVLASHNLTYSGRPTELRVTLTWDTSESDLDLHVTAPSGAYVNYENKTNGHLRLDVDNTTGFGPENISTEHAEQGAYQINVINYRGGVGTTAILHVYKNERLDRRESHTFSASNETWHAGDVRFD